jgi:hypothetical protein
MASHTSGGFSVICCCICVGCHILQSYFARPCEFCCAFVAWVDVTVRV